MPSVQTRRWGAAVLALALWVGVAAGQTSAAYAKTLVFCQDSWFKAKPKRCIFTAKGADPEIHAGHTLVGNIHWTSWGGPTARGTGTYIGNMDYRARVVLVLDRREPQCGPGSSSRAQAYTRLRMKWRTSGWDAPVRLQNECWD